MAWGKPKRSGYKPCCNQRGQCSCQRRSNAAIARNPAAAQRPCTVTLPNGKTCGRIVRDSVCPSPDH